MSEYLNLTNYPEDWDVRYGKEFLKLGGGVSPSYISFGEASGTPYMKVDDFNHPENHIYIRKTKLYFRQELNNVPLAAPNSIIIAKRGAAISKNRIRIAKQVIAVDTNLMTIMVTRDCEPLYFKYLLELIDLTSIADTTSIPQLNNFHLYECAFSLPPSLEQQKIASILTSVDEVIEKTEAQIGKLQDLKKGMMQELLTKGIGHTEFKDSPVGRIPKEWDITSVMAVAKVVDSMHQTPAFADKGFPMVRVTEIRQSDYLDISGAALVTEETFEDFSRNYKPKRGDILIARVGAYFGANSFVDEDKMFCLGQNTASIRPQNIVPEFLFAYLNSQAVRAQIEDSVAVGAQPSLSLNAIKHLRIAVPSLDEQNNISASIVSVRNRIRACANRLKQQRNINNALMQDLLTGKVRVKVN